MDDYFFGIDLGAFIPIFVSLFWAILFLQSGLDKVFDWTGNLSWLKGHFEKSILGGLVKPMLFTLTVIELLAGGISLFGCIYYLISGSVFHIYVGLILSIVSLLMLFFGQRLAKDYDGAKTIAIYFGVALISFFILN